MKTEDRIRLMHEVLRKYRKDHGEYPRSSDVLVGPYYAEPLLMRDGWDRKIIYIHTEAREGGADGYVVYSIGANAIDEHGEGDDIQFAGDVAGVR